MNPTAYIETSVVSYLTARPSRDLVIAAYQQITREWWRDAPRRFELVTSELVVSEAAAGDVRASRARLKMLEDISLLGTNEETQALAEKLLDIGAIPPKAADDAAHIAIAVTNGVDYLVTWNFRHRQCHCAIHHRRRMPGRRLQASGRLYAQRALGGPSHDRRRNR